MANCFKDLLMVTGAKQILTQGTQQSEKRSQTGPLLNGKKFQLGQKDSLNFSTDKPSH